MNQGQFLLVMTLPIAVLEVRDGAYQKKKKERKRLKPRNPNTWLDCLNYLFQKEKIMPTVFQSVNEKNHFVIDMSICSHGLPVKAYICFLDKEIGAYRESLILRVKFE